MGCPAEQLPSSELAARSAGLRWVNDARPGIRRQRCGKGFLYVTPDGKPVADHDVVDRIRALAIPPAWTRVWICDRADGHIQASGFDARSRKQYRYHAEWRRTRDAHKFARLEAFAQSLPRLRARVDGDLRRTGLDREKVVATVVRLLELTYVRVGNDEYARTNNSFGLTTLRNRHATITSSRVRFRFNGKGGKLHEVDVADRRLARILRSCQELPGQELFQYRDDAGGVQGVDSTDVNAYLREVTGVEFSAKDFRTWAATVLAAQGFASLGQPASVAEARRAVVGVVRQVAGALRNTPAICRRCYVHPAVIDAFESGVTLPRSLAGEAGDAVERAVIRLLRAAGRPRRPRRAPVAARRRPSLPPSARVAALGGADELSA